MALPNVKSFVSSQLKSAKVAEIILSNYGSGASRRKISFKPEKEDDFWKTVGGFLQSFGAKTWGFLVWAGAEIQKFFGWSSQVLVAKMQATFYYLWNFNWEITDDDIDRQLEGLYNTFAGMLGGTLGNAAGWLACGGLVGSTIFVFNDALGLYVLQELGEEALEEFAGNALALAYYSSDVIAQSIFLRLFQSNRALFNLARDEIGKNLDSILPFGPSWENYVKQRKRENGIITFADYVETSVESIPIPFIRNFVEEFLEEFGDACWESLYVVAGAVDRFLAERKTIKQQILGPERFIEIQPNRQSEEERILLYGNELEIKPLLTQTMAQHQFMQNRNVGQIVGEPLSEAIWGQPLTLRLCFISYQYKEEPFYRGGNKRPKEAKITVPNINRSKLDWELLKQVIGGESGYLWGRWFCRARFKDGRQIKFWAGSEQEGKQMMKALLQLTESELAGMTITEQLKEGDVLEHPRLEKETTTVYPGYVTIINRKEYMDKTKGRATSRGAFEDKKERIPLWVKSKPDNFDQIVQEILTWGTTSI